MKWDRNMLLRETTNAKSVHVKRKHIAVKRQDLPLWTQDTLTSPNWVFVVQVGPHPPRKCRGHRSDYRIEDEDICGIGSKEQWPDDGNTGAQGMLQELEELELGHGAWTSRLLYQYPVCLLTQQKPSRLKRSVTRTTCLKGPTTRLELHCGD